MKSVLVIKGEEVYEKNREKLEKAYLERQITGIIIKNLKGTQKISFHLSLSTYPAASQQFSFMKLGTKPNFCVHARTWIRQRACELQTRFSP